MALVKQLKTAGFRPKSRYNMFVGQLSKCSEQKSLEMC